MKTKVNTLNLYMDSMVNGKRVGDITFDEVRAGRRIDS